LDSAYYIPALLEAEDLAGEMARRVEYGACLKHELCWAASHSPEDIQTDQHTMESESLERYIRCAQQPDTKYTIIKYI
jgi:hypothetical protein